MYYVCHVGHAHARPASPPLPPPTADTDSRMQREERCAGRVVHLHVENFITQP